MAALASQRQGQEAFKICIMGDPMSGKSELTSALMNNTNSALRSDVLRDIAYISGTDRSTGKNYFIQFWDTAGTIRHNRFDMGIMLRDSVGVFVMFDLTNRLSYENVDVWVAEIHSRFRPSPTRPGVLLPFIYLVGCKLDRADGHDERQVYWDEIDAKATANGWGCAQISAIEPCHNLQELLEYVISELLRDKISRELPTDPHTTSPRITPHLLSSVFSSNSSEHRRNPFASGC